VRGVEEQNLLTVLITTKGPGNLVNYHRTRRGFLDGVY